MKRAKRGGYAVALDDFNILAQGHQQAHQTLGRDLPEITTQHSGNIGLFHAEKLGRCHLFQATLPHQPVDLQDQLGLEMVGLCIGQADVGKNIAAAGFVVDVSGHGNCLGRWLCTAVGQMGRR